MIFPFVIAFVLLGFVLFVYGGIKQKKPVNAEPKFSYTPIVKTDLSHKETELLNLINAHRDFLNLPALVPEALACQVCYDAIQEDIALGEKPSHYEWEKRKTLCRAADAKEILAYNMVEPKSVLAGYLRSNDHRAVIENAESTHIGIAYFNNINYCILTRY